MPRGKNYVNQNKGMFLQGRQKVTEACRYGAACTRSGCIYIHESTPETAEDSNAPCMAYLAGLCSFTKGCRRRHPSDQECERLVARYANLPCRYGSECRTQGCLYRHEDDDKKQNLPLPTLPVVVVKPTPVVSKSGAPLAEWMPAKSSSSSLGGSALLPQNGSTTAIPPLGSNNPIAGGTSAGTTPTTGIPTIMTPLQPMPFHPPPQPSGMTGFYPPPPMMMMMHGYPPPYDEYNGPPPPYGTAPPWYPSGPPLPPPYGGGGGPPSMIGSWKPAPIAQPQPMYYPSPPPPPPQLLPQSPPTLSWESEFPELSASNNGKNNNSIKNPDHSITDTNARF